MHRGFHLSTEALITLVFAVMLFSLPAQKCSPSMNELLIMQKESDLLKLWAKDYCPNSESIKKDFRLAFPGNRGVVNMCGKKLVFRGRGKKALSAEIFFFDSKLEKRLWRITVFN